MRRPTQFLVILAFLGFCVVPLAATFVGIRPAAVENRDLSAAPDFGPDRILDEDAYAETTRYLTDRFSLRGLAIKTRAKINEVVWRTDSDRVSRGTGDWLYLTDSFNRLCEDPLDSVEAVDAFVDFVEAIEASGKTVGLTVAPSKPAAYPEYLSEQARDDAECVNGARDDMRAQWAEASVDWYVDLYDPIAAAKATAPEPLYHDRDTHWTEVGAVVMMGELLPVVDDQVWDEGSVVDRGTQSILMDLTNLLGLPRDGEVPDIDVERSGVSTSEPTVTAVEGSLPIRRFASTSDDAPLIEGRTVFIHDSFSEMVLPEMATHFADVTYVHWNAVLTVDLVSLLAEADTVMMEVAEREFAWRAGELTAVSEQAGPDFVARVRGDG